MRLALIADIHGNMTALETVLSDLHKRSVDQIICLGDVTAGGAQPREVLRSIQKLGCPVIMGNNDAWQINPRLTIKDNLIDAHNQDINLWCSQQYTESEKDFLRTFQATVNYPLPGGKNLLCYHGSPRSFRQFLNPITPNETLDEAFAGYTADIFAGGHTHFQMFRRYRDKLVINPGSVGMALNRAFPLDETRYTPWAEYAILTLEQDEEGVELRRIPFNLQAYHQAILASGLPHAEWLIDEWTPR
ncbi:metallophosphoesterase family protein [Tengunoibacter tsumagoiensis]|uniref:Phosphoesterase n=1 Tax=Tengunoibacter tsumagoiensis TaxID=2014871 RepID=A0A401ZX78_9CHLR|nr:metallophosphoesterase family protein [Tengunoibacter tsumagoiensis]GCE11443.1 phosphoesterase [Tengunoibacter tsumagoiensis]